MFDILTFKVKKNSTYKERFARFMREIRTTNTNDPSHVS